MKKEHTQEVGREPTSSRSPQIKPKLAVLAIVLMVFTAYGLSLNNGFVWDDETFIVNNEYVYDISQWRSYFIQSETISDHPILSRMYRPAQTLSFALDAALWKTWGGGFHLTSILIHLAACFAIFFAFAPLVGNRASIIAVMIFSVHPALSEGVLSLASRGNQLYTLFALLSIGLFVRVVRPLDKFHVFSVFAGLIALFSKEPAIVYLALLPLVQVVFRRPWPLNNRQVALLYAPFLMIGGLYLWARAAVVASSQVMPYWGGSLGATILLQAKVFIVYLKLLIWPFHLQGRYSVGEADALAIAAVIVNVILVVVAIIAWRFSRRGKLLALAIAWFYLSLAPVSNLIPLPGAMMGERFIYFTFAGMIPLLLASMDINRWSRHSKKILPPVFVLLAAFLITDITRAMVWKDDAHFFRYLSQQEPKNPAVQINMAKVELEEGKPTAAVSRLEWMVKANFSPPYKEDLGLLNFWYGKALLLSDRPVEAYVQLSKAEALGAKHTQDLVLLQVEAAARSNKLEDARTLIEREIQATPGESVLWNALGNVLSMSGDRRGAIDAYTKSVELNPSNEEAVINLQNLQQSRLD